jgi:hypothetical protein
MDQGDIKKKIIKIYKKQNPSKLPEVDSLLVKYAGKEEELLRSIRKKYTKRLPWEDNNFCWTFNLKHFNDQHSDKDKRQRSIWYVQESLQQVQYLLDQLAEQIGGKCDIADAKGHLVLVAKRDMAKPLCSKEDALLAVEKMKDLVHNRYRHKERPTDTATEHDRRRLEKQRDKDMRAAIDKGRSRKGSQRKKF